LEENDKERLEIKRFHVEGNELLSIVVTSIKMTRNRKL